MATKSTKKIRQISTAQDANEWVCNFIKALGYDPDDFSYVRVEARAGNIPIVTLGKILLNRDDNKALDILELGHDDQFVVRQEIDRDEHTIQQIVQRVLRQLDNREWMQENAKVKGDDEKWQQQHSQS